MSKRKAATRRAESSSKSRPLLGRVVGVALALLAATAAWWLLSGPGKGPDPAEEARGWKVADLEGHELSAEVDAAVRSARSEVLKDPTSAAAWGVFGEVLDAHELREQAVEAYEHAQALDPDNGRWPYVLGGARASLGRPAEEFGPDFERATLLRPDDPAVRLRHGEALVATGQSDEGLRVLAGLVGRRPDLAAAREAYASALLAAGRPEEAATQLEAALEVVPDSSRALSFLAQAYGRLGRTEEARAAGERSREATGKAALPDPVRYQIHQRRVDAVGLSNKATALMEAGRFPEAVEAWQRFLAAAGDEPVALMHLGTALRRSGREAEAIAPFTKAVARRDDLIPAHYQLSLLLNRRGLHEDARRRAQRVLEDEPEHWQARTQLGVAETALGDWTSAIETLATASVANGRVSPQGETAWGESLLMLGRAQEALPHLELARRDLATEPRLLFLLGETWNALGNADAARSFWQQAARLGPGATPAESRLAAAGG